MTTETTTISKGPEAEGSGARGRAQIVQGVVVRDKMSKTRVIELLRGKQHYLYSKKMARKVKLFIHDENNESHIGDKVMAVASRPISRNKSFRLLKVLEKKA